MASATTARVRQLRARGEGGGAAGAAALPVLPSHRVRVSFAGVLKFARLIKSYESQDPEIASMSGKLKALFLPPMALPSHGPGTGGVATS